MSMHAIEDLIEDTVRWIDPVDLPPAAKRTWLSNLYAIQARFDTSYTHFRVMDILLKHRFVYRIPLAEYQQKAPPDHAIREGSGEGWVHAGAGEDAPLAYLTTGPAGAQLYVDAGSDVWQYACEYGLLPAPDREPPASYPPVAMIATLLEHLERHGANDLLSQWHAFFVNAVLDGDFGWAEGIPDGFAPWLDNEHLLLIRTISQRNRLAKKKKEDNDVLALPGLADELRLQTAPVEIYRVRFLLDLKKSPAQLAAGYQRDSRPAANPGEKTALIYQKTDAFLTTGGWTYAGEGKEHHWLWYKDVPGTPRPHRLFILLQSEPGDKSLFVKLAVQHGLLLHWQQAEPATSPEHWHFFDDIYSSLPAAFKEGNKQLNDWGAWKYDIKQTVKALSARMDHVTAGIAQGSEVYFNHVLSEFPDRFFTREPARLLHLLEEGEDGTGIIPDYVLFGSKYHILLAFVFHHLHNGETARAKELMEQAKAFADSGRINGTLRDKILAPVFALWERGEPLVYPPVWHTYLLRALAV